MKQISLKGLTLVAVLATGLATAQTGDNQTSLNQIAGYRTWTRVNRKPVEVAVTATPLDIGSQQAGI